MRVMVTGARGFVGRETVRLLQGTGGHRVTAVDAEVDLRSRPAVDCALRDARPDAVVHLGGVSGPMVHADDPSLVTTVNAVGTTNILHSALALPHRPRVVVASSIAAVERLSVPAPSIYAATKRFVEDAVRYFSAHGLETMTIRLGSVYGAGRSTDHVLHSMIDALASTGSTPFDPRAVEPLIHVHDAARALVAATESTAASAEPLIAVQECVAHEELAALTAQILGLTTPRLRPVPGEYCDWTEPLVSGPLAKALGFRFSVSVRQGVTELARALTA